MVILLKMNTYISNLNSYNTVLSKLILHGNITDWGEA